MSTSSDIKTRGFPYALLGISLLIPLFGILNLASAAKVTRPGLWLTQSAWLSMGIVLASVVVLLPSRWLHRMAYPIYMVVNVLLVLVLVAGLTIKGAQRWLDLGFFHLQPSELAKISVLIATARYFAAYHVPSGYTLLLRRNSGRERR
jgi:rod shape determining protein RodA